MIPINCTICVPRTRSGYLNDNGSHLLKVDTISHVNENDYYLSCETRIVLICIFIHECEFTV